MGADHVLHSFVQTWHVAVHASASVAPEWMVRVPAPSFCGLIVLVAFQAQRVVLGSRQRPLRPNRLVRIMTIDARQLCITGSTHRVVRFRGIPGRHTSGKLWSSAGMTTTADKVDVVFAAPEIHVMAVGIDEKLWAVGKKSRPLQFALHVLSAAKVARLAADPQRRRMYRGLQLMERFVKFHDF